MSAAQSKHKLNLLGPFGLFGPDGVRIEISSKKGMALLALLATARDGTRSRGWLQDMLWGSREAAQAQASLRRELSNLRQAVNRGAAPLLVASHGRATLALDRLDVDMDRLGRGAAGASAAHWGQFLEGLDIAGEEGFEDWLRQQRAAAENLVRGAGAARRESEGHSGLQAQGIASLPLHILDPSDVAEGFLGRPVVAVLPFANLTGERGNDYLAEGIADDLIEQLSKLRWLPVIARGASFAHSTETATLQEIGAALGARYIVEGRLRGRGSSFGLTASVSDVESSRTLWTRRLEFPVESTATELGPLLTEIVGALSAQVDDAEMTRAVARPKSDLNVNDLIWRARWHHNQYTPEDSMIAQALLEEALTREPHSPEAMIQLAFFRQRQIWLERGDAKQIQQLRRLAQRAISADYNDGRGYMIAGIAEVWMKHTRAAIVLLQQAIALNPSLAYAYSQLGAAYYLSGDPEPAIDLLTRALRLSMGEPYTYYVLAEIAMARAMMGEWGAAIEAADQAIGRRTAYWYAHVTKIHALVSQGDTDAAKAAFEALRSAKPGFNHDFIDWLPFVERKWPDLLKQSLFAVGYDELESRRREQRRA
jgi:TolB-like protein/DNA-binding SARP family transcriptional activator